MCYRNKAGPAALGETNTDSLFYCPPFFPYGPSGYFPFYIFLMKILVETFLVKTTIHIGCPILEYNERNFFAIKSFGDVYKEIKYILPNNSSFF